MPGLVLPLRAVAKLLVNNILQSGGFEHVRFQKMTAADAPADGTPCSVAAELRRVFAAQEARATEYNKFRRAFEELLANGDNRAYTAICGTVAEAFRDASADVNAAEAALRAAGHTGLGDSIRQLQVQEKEQLRLEATLQVLRKEHARGAWAWQQPGGGAGQALEAEPPAADAPLRAPWATAGPGAGCRSAAEHGAASCGCGRAPTDPTEEEYTGAVSEVRVAQQAAITAINDVLDELRQALADAAEEEAG